jgi:penicillin-binding protein 2
MNKKDKAFYNKKNYAGTSFVGKTGIEKQYETLLHGKNGKKQIERNVTGRVINSKNIQEPEQGSDLYLSIDLALQKKAESLLKGKRGSIVAVDTTNGEVLVMVSTPIYNPNWFVNGISHKNYNKLQTSKDIPQLNRAIQGLYPPGSTIKPMVALAGLEQGVITAHQAFILFFNASFANKRSTCIIFLIIKGFVFFIHSGDITSHMHTRVVVRIDSMEIRLNINTNKLIAH